jgi:hypothetical protein
MCLLNFYFFFKIIITNDENDKQIFNIFYINLHPIFFFPKWLWIQLNIKFNLINWIQIHFQMDWYFIQCILIKFSVIESKLNWI